jgi:hypothetical protein
MFSDKCWEDRAMVASRLVLRRVCAAAGLAVFLASCVDTIDEEHSRIGDVVQDCVVPFPAGVADWGAPVSLEQADGSIWVWDSLTLQDGKSIRNAFGLVRTAADACAGRIDLVRDGAGRPASAIALSSAEIAANAARTDGRRLDLVATGGFVDAGRGFLYYEERLSGPGVFDSQLLGRGLCVFEHGETAPCTRVVRSGTTRLWGPDSHPFNRGGFVDDAGFALVYGCDQAAAFEDVCIVARVPVQEAADPAAYRFFNPFSGWIEDPRNAGNLFNRAGSFTVRWNAFLGRYTAIGTDIFASSVILSRSAEPTGDFDSPDVLFDAVKPASFFLAGGIEHAALSEEAGRIVRVSYFTNADGPEHGLHLVSFRFLGDQG